MRLVLALFLSATAAAHAAPMASFSPPAPLPPEVGGSPVPPNLGVRGPTRLAVRPTTASSPRATRVFLSVVKTKGSFICMTANLFR